jgi:2-enoate reductase
MKKTSAISALDVIRGAKTGENVLIIGGGIVGSETALLLGKQGKKVTITTRQSEIGQGLSTEMKRAYFSLLANLPITTITKVRLEEVTADGAVVGTFYGEKTALKADTIVIAGGFKPHLKLWDELSQVPQLEVYAIGDCVEPRSAYDAIHEGFHTAFELI